MTTHWPNESSLHKMIAYGLFKNGFKGMRNCKLDCNCSLEDIASCGCVHSECLPVKGVWKDPYARQLRLNL